MHQCSSTQYSHVRSDLTVPREENMNGACAGDQFITLQNAF